LVRESGEKIAEEKVKIPKQNINYQLEPHNKAKFEHTLNEIKQISGKKQDFFIHLWFDRSDGIYRE
jgi:hypothetical protein